MIELRRHRPWVLAGLAVAGLAALTYAQIPANGARLALRKRFADSSIGRRQDQYRER